jgi:hypothetical protein
MRVSLLLCLTVALCVAGSAHAEGQVGLYRDVDMASCSFSDEAPGILNVHVVQSSVSASASEFQLLPRQGANLTYLGEAIPATLTGAMGRADIGVAVSYGGCVEPPILVMTVLYQGFGLSETCGQIAILNRPGSNLVLADHVAYITCGGIRVSEARFAEAGHAVVNPDETCECGTDPGGGQVPVETATWGKVKSLYEN